MYVVPRAMNNVSPAQDQEAACSGEPDTTGAHLEMMGGKHFRVWRTLSDQTTDARQAGLQARP